ECAGEGGVHTARFVTTPSRQPLERGDEVSRHTLVDTSDDFGRGVQELGLNVLDAAWEGHRGLLHRSRFGVRAAARLREPRAHRSGRGPPDRYCTMTRRRRELLV